MMELCRCNQTNAPSSGLSDEGSGVAAGWGGTGALMSDCGGLNPRYLVVEGCSSSWVVFEVGGLSWRLFGDRKSLIASLFNVLR
jgi:hypothetical protein